MVKDIIHIHVPKSGGTWLNKTLEKYASESFMRTGLGDGNRCSIGEPLQFRGRWSPPSPYFYNNRKPDEATYGWRSIHRSTGSSGEDHLWWRDGTHKVSICRNPFDYLVSHYHFDDIHNPHLKKLRRYMPEGVALGAGLCNLRHGIRSFDEYVEKFCDPEFPWHGTNTIEDEQRYFLFHQMFNHDGTCGVNQIIRNEKLSDGTAVMLRELGHIEDDTVAEITNSKRLNVSSVRKKKDYRSYYSDAQREMIERKCKAELLLYGYDFDGPTDDSPFVEPTSLFYHPIIPTAGKFLAPQLQQEFDKKIRAWIGDEPENKVFIGSDQLDYVRGAQSIYPDTWVRALGVKVTDTTPGDPHILVLGNPMTPKVGNNGWWKVELSRDAGGPFTLLDCPYYFDKLSFKDVLVNPSHPYADHSAHKGWVESEKLFTAETEIGPARHPPEMGGNAIFWQSAGAEELIPLITNHFLR